MDDSAEEMKLLDTEALKIEAREDDAAGSTGVVLFNLWMKSMEDMEALRMVEATAEVKDAMDSSSAPSLSRVLLVLSFSISERLQGTWKLYE